MQTATSVPTIATLADMEGASVAGLRILVRAAEIKGTSGFNRAQLVAALMGETIPVKPRATSTRGPTVADLKRSCKDAGLDRLSGLNRANLIEYLETRERPVVIPKLGSAAALHAECKSRGLKGHSGLKRDDLITYLGTGVIPPAEIGSSRWVREFARSVALKGRSKVRGGKVGLLCALCDAGYGPALESAGYVG